MRIVQIANFVHDRSGGIRTAIDSLSAHYVGCGHEVMLIRPGAHHHLERDHLGRVVVQLPGVTLPASGGYRVMLRRAPVASVIASWRPDVVEVDDKSTLAWIGGYARSLGARSVMFSHERLDLVIGDHLGAPRLGRRAARWHQRRVVPGFDLVLCPSEFAAAELDGLGEVRRAVVPLGVDLDRFHPDHRRSVTRPARPRRIVIASRLTRDKHPLLAAAAVSELRHRGDDVELVVAGAGPLERAMFEHSGTDGGLRLLGHVTDRDHLAALLADADAVVCPGRRETFGLSALEALASGTAVVGMSESAVAELIVPGTGVACRPDPVVIADSLARLLDGDRDAQRLASRRRAEDFTWSRAGDAILAHFRTLTTGRPSTFQR